MRVGVLACVLGLLAAAAGCSVFEDAPPDVPAGPLVFPVERLGRLDLGSVKALFAPDERVSVEAFNPAVSREEDFQGGAYVFGKDGGITVRVYGSASGAAAGLLAIVRAARDRFAAGLPTARFPREWWYRQGPPATILFSCGNVVALIRASRLAADRIPADGLDAAADVVRRLAEAAE